MKKLVAIPGWKINTKYGDDAFGAGINHLEFISRMGGIPRILFPEEELPAEIGMLYLPGGGDLLTDSYGRAPGLRNTAPDLFKEYFFRTKLKSYVDAGIPIFGVCLGMQMLNVYFGGTLTQHLMDHEDSKERGEKGHEVYNIRNGKRFDVNSHHHQGVDELGAELEAECYYGFEDKSKEGATFKLVESFRHRSRPIIGVQWHPEEFYDTYSQRAFKELLKYDIKK